MADLGLLAMMSDGDRSAIPVLGDALIEDGWLTQTRRELIMALCLGVPLDPVPPRSIKTREGRAHWARKRRSSLAFARTQWDLYAVGGRRDWGKAVLSVMLFEDWKPAKKTAPHGSRCPWPLVRRNATAERRGILAERKRVTEEYRREREQETKQGIQSIAQRYGSGP